MPGTSQSIHIDLDGAWNAASLGLRTLDFRDFGPRLRYFCSGGMLNRLDALLPRPLPPFILYGSGDFHHLSALWLRRAAAEHDGPITLVSFDNHPDCDIRPPRYACGGWINRALDLPNVRQAHVWGCGNFELAFPSRLFANRSAIRAKNLILHPWTERQGEGVRRRFECMSRENWREQFTRFAGQLGKTSVYITVDLDCLSAGEAVTNWESGLFTAGDIAWAIEQLRANATLIAGDVCGAYSPLAADGFMRRLAVWWDHPRLPQTALPEARAVNEIALKTIWPALVTNG